MKICSVEGCERKAIKRGWCEKHYARWQRHGDPLYTKQAGWGEGQELLSQWIAERGRDECWDNWPFGTGGEYPSVGRKRATHVVLELDGFLRPEPPLDNALHTCDNKNCLNPDHLWWGTKKENAVDYAGKWVQGKDAQQTLEKLVAWLDENGIDFPEEMRPNES